MTQPAPQLVSCPDCHGEGKLWSVKRPPPFPLRRTLGVLWRDLARQFWEDGKTGWLLDVLLVIATFGAFVSTIAAMCSWVEWDMFTSVHKILLHVPAAIALVALFCVWIRSAVRRAREDEP